MDCGPAKLDDSDDYPPYVMRAASAAVADPGSLGIVIGGSGNGEQIAANKVRGVRAALAWNEETARLARLHNDANVLSLGAREQPIEQAVTFARAFVSTEFSAAPAARPATEDDRRLRAERGNCRRCPAPSGAVAGGRAVGLLEWLARLTG